MTLLFWQFWRDSLSLTSYKDVRLEIFSGNPVENVMKTRRASGIGAFHVVFGKKSEFVHNLSPNFLQQLSD